MRESYVSSLRKVPDAGLAESFEVAQQGVRVQVIDRALPPGEPEMRRTKYLLVGLLATLAGAARIAGLLELIDPVIVSQAQLEEDLGLPVIGGVPDIA